MSIYDGRPRRSINLWVILGHGLHVLADSVLPRNDFFENSYRDKEKVESVVVLSRMSKSPGQCIFGTD